MPLQDSSDSVLPQTPTVSHLLARSEPSYFSSNEPKLSQTATTNHGNHPPDSSYASPYAGAKGTKRKRGDSPQPTRGSPPVRPPFSEPTRNDAPSDGALSVVTLKPNSLASAGTRPADDSEAVDLQIASTPQNSERLEVESHPMASVSPVIPTAQGQNVDPDSLTTIKHIPIVDEQIGSKTPSEMESLVVTLKLKHLPDFVSNLDHGDASHQMKASMTESALDRTISSLPTLTGIPGTIDQPADNNVIPTVERSSVAPSRAPLSVDASVADQPSVSEPMNTASPSPAPVAGEPKATVKNSRARWSRSGGSVAFLRRKIIMELMEKCDGVFPSHGEILLPFAAEWAKRRGEDGMPERKTVLNAVNQLCAEDKLRKITFSFQNKHGIITTRTMLTLPNVDITDPRIKATQAQIAAHHPRLYIPPALLPEDAHHNYRQSGESLAENQVPANLTKGEHYKVQARLAVLRAQDREDTEHPLGVGSTAGLQSDLDATADGSVRNGKMLIVPSDAFNPPRAPRVPKPPKIRFRRLRSLMKKRDQHEPPPFPLPQEIDGLENDEDSLTWLPSQYAFTEYNFEEERPTLLTLATDQTRKRGSYISKRVRFSKPTKQRTPRMQEIAENAARIERNQAQGKKPYLLNTETLQEPFRSPCAPVRPPSPRVGTPGSQDLPYTSPYSEASRRILTGSDIGSMDAGRRDSIVSESTTVSSSLDLHDNVHGTKSILDLRTSPRHKSQPQLKRAALVGFMDPTHYFNRLSGTFHVSFSGIGPPRKLIYGGRGPGTAIKPFVHGVQGRDKRPAKRRKLE